MQHPPSPQALTGVRVSGPGAAGVGLGGMRTKVETIEIPTRAAQAADEDDDETRKPEKRPGFSSGERQIRALREIVERTHASIYLLDEWDANLDLNNRAAADELVERLAKRARVVEISHRDRT